MSCTDPSLWMRIDTATLVLPAVESFYGRLCLLHRHAITASLSSLRFACLLIFLHRDLSSSSVLFFRRSCRSLVATLSLSTFTSAARLLLTEVNTSLSNWEVTGCDFAFGFAFRAVEFGSWWDC